MVVGCPVVYNFWCCKKNDAFASELYHVYSMQPNELQLARGSWVSAYSKGQWQANEQGPYGECYIYATEKSQGLRNVYLVKCM